MFLTVSRYWANGISLGRFLASGINTFIGYSSGNRLLSGVVGTAHIRLGCVNEMGKKSAACIPNKTRDGIQEENYPTLHILNSTSDYHYPNGHAKSRRTCKYLVHNDEQRLVRRVAQLEHGNRPAPPLTRLLSIQPNRQWAAVHFLGLLVADGGSLSCFSIGGNYVRPPKPHRAAHSSVAITPGSSS